MTIEQELEEDILKITLRHAFTCKFYCNIIPMIESEFKTNNHIYMSLNIFELFNYIENANRIFEKKDPNKVINIFESKFLRENLILKKDVNVNGIDGNIQSDFFDYDGTITDFETMNIESLTDSEKEAFYGEEAQRCLGMFTVNIKDKNNIKKVKAYQLK